MPNIPTYLIIIGLLILSLAFLNRRNPQKVDKYWKAAIVSISVGWLWSMHDQITSFGNTLGIEWVFSLGMLAIVGFVLWGAFLRKPKT